MPFRRFDVTEHGVTELEVEFHGFGKVSDAKHGSARFEQHAECQSGRTTINSVLHHSLDLEISCSTQECCSGTKTLINQQHVLHGFSSCVRLEGEDFEEVRTDSLELHRAVHQQPSLVCKPKAMSALGTEAPVSSNRHNNPIRNVVYACLCAIEEENHKPAMHVDEHQISTKTDHFKSFIHGGVIDVPSGNTMPRELPANEFTQSHAVHWRSMVMHDSEML